MSVSQDILILTAQFLVDSFYETIETIGEPESVKPFPRRIRRGKRLNQSKLYTQKRIKYQLSANGFEIVMPSYTAFIDEGRFPTEIRGGTGLGSTGQFIRRPPISAIIRQLQDNGIAAGRNNEVAQAIATAITLRGIRPRPFIEKTLDKFIQSDELFEIFYNQLIDTGIERFFTGIKKI